MDVLLAVSGWEVALWRGALAAELPERRIVAAEELGAPERIRYALIWRHPPGALAGLPNLAAIFSLGAGVDHALADPDLPAAPLVRVVDPDLTARMSEWAALQVLLHFRQFRRYDRQQQARIWGEDAHQPAAREVRVGVLGLGEIGLDAARKLQALGFAVAGWTRTAREIPGLETHHGPAGLEKLLGRTDILVSLLPATPQTRGLLNRELIGKLARDGALGGPFLINAGRGASQVEADIVEALQSGALKGASLDVFETEPLPADSPLWGFDNLFISPHNAGLSAPAAIARYVAGQIRAFERGEPLSNVVDRRRSY